MTSFWKNKKLVGGIIFTILSFAVSLGIVFNIFDVWQLRFSQFLFQNSSSSPSSDIIIVKINDETLDERKGLGNVNFWSRNYYAQVLENINKYQPKVVVFDVFFGQARDQIGDDRFSQTLSLTKNGVLMFPIGLIWDSSEQRYIQDIDVAVTLPLEKFRETSNTTPSIGYFLPDQDNVIRKYLPAVYNSHNEEIYKSLGIVAVEKFLDVTMEDLDIPLEDNQMLINFFSKLQQNQQYKNVSFLEVYNEDYIQFDPKFFKDKIVLIGAYTKRIQDFHLTPVSSEIPMFGVEIHANAIQTILDQKFLRNMTTAEKIALIAVLTLAASFIFLYTRLHWSLAFLVGTSTLYTAVAPFAFEKGLILDLVHPYLALILTFITVYLYRYTTEFKEKTALRTAFSRYVNPQLVQQITDHPEQLKLGGETRDITVLFTDIVHFTTLAERLKPESLVALLNEYFKTMADVIMAEGGTMDKFEGDAIMAFFGAPLPQQDHAVRACRAALIMRQKLQELSAKWAQDPPLPGGETKPMIDFRCGISSGEAVVGNVGSTQHQEYTVMGDTVNLGSRLESANKKYQTHTMISEATYETVKDFFEARELDIVKVMGKTKPIKIYELLNFKDQLIPAAARLLKLYNEGIQLYHERRFAEALSKFTDLLKEYPQDGPSQLYRQRCEVLKSFPPASDWDGVFEMGEK